MSQTASPATAPPAAAAGRTSPVRAASPAGSPANAAAPAEPAAGTGPGARAGTLSAALGVLAFSTTFPSTAWALEGFGPFSLVSVRALIAATVAGVLLVALRVPLPARRHWAGLAVVGGGVVVGFPLLTTLALRTSSTSHAAVVVGLLPLTTAAFAAVRNGSRPSRTFWAAALTGAATVLGFVVATGGGAWSGADGYLLGALVVCAAGYVEGGRLARVMPGWQVMGWALVLCLPLALAGAAAGLSYEPLHLNLHAVTGVVWAGVCATFLGGYLWYRGIAAIGAPRASQLQLAQPLLTLGWSVALLGEQPGAAAPLTAVVVLVCIAVTQRA